MFHAWCLQVGPQGVGLKVKDPKKYHFDPKSLLLQICEVRLHGTVMLIISRLRTGVRPHHVCAFMYDPGVVWFPCLCVVFPGRHRPLARAYAVCLVCLHKHCLFCYCLCEILHALSYDHRYSVYSSSQPLQRNCHMGLWLQSTKFATTCHSLLTQVLSQLAQHV